MKRVKIVPLIIMFVTIMCYMACMPLSKDQYFDQYEQFMEEVKKTHRIIDKDEWAAYDKQHKLFYEQYYEQYEDEMSIGEKLKVKQYQISYGAYRLKSQTENVFDGL
jgi:hypothetical protein